MSTAEASAAELQACASTLAAITSELRKVIVGQDEVVEEVLIALFTGGLPGKGRSSRRTLQTTTNATTIRDYFPGDAHNRIHWRSSAHYSKLMVNEFDLDPAVDAWIFLDLHDEVQAGEDEQSTEEQVPRAPAQQ